MRKRRGLALAAACQTSASTPPRHWPMQKTVLQHEGEFDLVLLDLWCFDDGLIRRLGSPRRIRAFEPRSA